MNDNYLMKKIICFKGNFQFNMEWFQIVTQFFDFSNLWIHNGSCQPSPGIRLGVLCHNPPFFYFKRRAGSREQRARKTR